MYVLNKAWSEELEILKKRLRDCRCYGNNVVSKWRIFSLQSNLAGNSSVSPIFYFIKCFLLVFGIILTNLRKFYQARILQTQ